MGQYTTSEHSKLVGCLPPADFDVLESMFPGTFEALAESWSRIFDGRLRKRYVVPFKDPVPEIVRYHVAQCVNADLYRKRGFNPGSEQDSLIIKAKEDALAWLKEAADSKEGLVELPIKDDGDANAISKAAPLGYSETSPYVWTDVQATDGHSEDDNGFGR